MQMEAGARGGWGHESPGWGQEEGARAGLNARELREPLLARGTHRGCLRGRNTGEACRGGLGMGKR
jgi:hypothetical protein